MILRDFIADQEYANYRWNRAFGVSFKHLAEFFGETRAIEYEQRYRQEIREIAQ